MAAALLERQEVMMSYVRDECAAMAARMLDAELVWIVRKLPDPDRATVLQKAVLTEIRKRALGE
jgi:hypothetical protein